MSKKTIDDGVNSLSTLDPKEVLAMLNHINSNSSFIHQIADMQGVKNYIVKSVVIEAKKIAEAKIAAEKQEVEKKTEEKQLEVVQVAALLVGDKNVAEDGHTDAKLSGDSVEELD